MGWAGGLCGVAARVVVAIEVGVLMGLRRGDEILRCAQNDMWGSHLFVSFVSGGSCLELIRSGNRIREGLIDFVPEID